jgi:regulator of protease activity HflC (stomatin/prohibitin superfamily)
MDGALHRDATSPPAPPPLPDGPVAQSVAIAFRALYVATVLLALFWATGNIRQVPPDAQAVVTRFGQVVQVRQSGLVLALPRPIDTVTLLPSRDRQLPLDVVQAQPTAGLEDVYTRASGQAMPSGAGAFLTGDGGVVLLQASLFYQVDDAAAYFLAHDHVAPALRRLFLSAAVSLAATRDLDDFLVTRADRGTASGAGDAAARRDALRADLVRAIDARLDALTKAGAPLGVRVSRVDLQAALPPSAKMSFDGVLEAVQIAEQGLAQARTDATKLGQQAEQERDRLLSAARASAAERVSEATTRTASVVAIEARITPRNRPGLLDQVYRDRLAVVMQKLGTLTAIDPKGGARVILPGGSRP